MDAPQTTQQNKFDFGGYYNLRGYQDNNRSMSINAFNGAISFAIWDRQHQGGPIDSISLTREFAHLFKKTLKEMLDAQPNTSIPIGNYTRIFQGQGQPTKWEKNVTFNFIKDDRQMYFLEVQTQKVTSPIKFMFKSAPFLVNTDDISDSERSALHVKALLEIFEKEIPHMRVISCFNKVKMPRNGNKPSAPRAPATPSYTNNDEPY